MKKLLLRLICFSVFVYSPLGYAAMPSVSMGVSVGGSSETEGHDISNATSDDCQECHEEIYDQWKSSMHAQSTALDDPIHATFYNAVVGDPRTELMGEGGKDKYPVCLQCHSPAAAKAGKTKLDSVEAYAEGVNCISCHTIQKFNGTHKEGGGSNLGMKAYEYSTTKLYGPRGTEKKHREWGKGVEGNPAVFRTSDACMGCHDRRNNSKNVPLCQTGSEIAEAGGASTCQSCHMAPVKGLANHAMMGGHDPVVVAKGLVMTIDASKGNDTIETKINVRNLLPHEFPTGAPFRNFFIRLTAYDSNGVAVWKNSESHPMKDDKQAMFMYVIGNDDGPAPPPMATKVLANSRLKPLESRDLAYSIPAADVVKVEAVAYYDLLLEPIKEKYGESMPKALLKPQEIAVASQTFE